MNVLNSSRYRPSELMPVNEHIRKHWLKILIGATLAFLMSSLTACGTQPVYRTVPAAKVQIPDDLTSPLSKPNCLFKSNANLGDCILMQNGVIERANADRDAVRKIVESQ